MGKLGKSIAADVMSGSSNDDGEYSDDEDKEGADMNEPEMLAMRAFRDAFNSGDVKDAVDAFKKLCDVTMEYKP
jgi:hypothetical protein